MADTWHESTKAALAEISAKTSSGLGGPQEVKALQDLPEPPTGPSGLCKAHAAVWTQMREELVSEPEPTKLNRRAWFTKWLPKHERVIAGIAACPGCERPAPAPSSREFSAEPSRGPRRRRRGPPRRR